MDKAIKSLATLSLAFVLFLALAACGAEKPEYVIRYAFTSPQSSQVGKIAEGFRNRVYEFSKGRIDVEYYPDAQLGDKLANMESLRAGELEMCDAASTDLSGYKARWSVFALPYNFTSAREMLDVCRSPEVYAMLDADATSAGFKLISFCDFGTRSVFNGRRAVTNPSEANGIKIRVMQDPVLAQTLNLMGFSAVSLGWSEVYTAMQQRTIDGCEQNEALCADNKLYEVAKYYCYTEHFRIPGMAYMSNVFFESLPADLQDAVIRAGIANEEDITRWFPAYNQASIDTMKKNGVEFIQVDKAAFEKAIAPIHDFYFKSAPAEAKALYDKMVEVRAGLRGK